MKKLLVGAAAAFALTAGGAAYATPHPHPPAVNPPTLHGFCNTAAPCLDNGTNTPTSVNPPQFGFSAGGSSATGDVFIDILVPNNVTLPSSYILSGPLVGASTFTASLFSSTAWTSGQLDSYLGISASPTNPIGNYLPAANFYQPSATGFFVFQADLGTQTLPSNSGAANSDLLTTNLKLAQGSFALAFIKQGTAYGATANSGAIFETGVPEPATWAMMLTGFFGMGALLRRRRVATAAA